MKKKPASKSAEPIKVKKERRSQIKDVWINPIGGMGDTLMLSGVLKLVVENNPSMRFNLVRRTHYSKILKGHPAIKKIGFPPKNAKIMTNDYWSKERLGKGNQRPFQILARSFGLSTPVEEKLYFPGKIDENDLLLEFIPWGGKKTALIAPSSDSPRKTMHPMVWQNMVEELTKKDVFVVQAGKMNEIYIKGAYSLLGLTTPGQLMSLVKKCDVVLTIDNFIMHTSHLVGTPAVVFWGPTRSSVYGYPEQVHLQASLEHCKFRNKCLGPDFPHNYGTPCPLENKHCMNSIRIKDVFNAVARLLN